MATQARKAYVHLLLSLSLLKSFLKEVLAVFVSKATLSVCKGEEQKVVVSHYSKLVVIKSLQETVKCIHRLFSFCLIAVPITVDVFFSSRSY